MRNSKLQHACTVYTIRGCIYERNVPGSKPKRIRSCCRSLKMHKRTPKIDEKSPKSLNPPQNLIVATTLNVYTCIYIYVFIHSGHFYSAPSSPLPLRGALEYSTDTSIGVSRRSAQATAGKGLAQGPYATARAGVEPTTLRLRVIASTNAPSRPTYIYIQGGPKKTAQ